MARCNARAGRPVVLLAGELRDPRAAYAAADVCLGMGGSALRAMAFAKPLVVQGEGGFWELLTPDTVDRFLWTGWYGVGDDPARGAAVLADILRPLLAETGVALAPGVDFDPADGHRWVRFSFAGSADDVRGALDRLGNWLA